MFKQLINKIKCWEATTRIWMFGPDHDKLKGFIAQRVNAMVATYPQIWTCTYVRDKFGEKAHTWYLDELNRYSGLHFTQVPFSYLAQRSGRTKEQERLLFTEFLKRKYP